MSNTVFSLCKFRKVGSPTRKAVLLLMADFASDDGSGIWASKPNMAADLELSETALRDAIRALIAAGLIREVGTRRHQNGFTVEYLIDLKAVSALPLTRENVPVLTPAAAAPLRQPHHTPTPAAPQDLRQAHPNHPLTTIEPPEDTKRTRRAVALPPNWTPSERNLSDAKARNFTDEEIDEQAAAFRDHHHARGTTFKDWDAGWRTWLGNARRFGSRSPARHPRPSSAHDQLFGAFQRAAGRD